MRQSTGTQPRPEPPTPRVNQTGGSPQAALKVLYLTVASLDPTGKGRARWSNRCKAALNAFDITFDGRVSAGRR